MKRSELVEIAKRKGTVMWLNSGCIEHLHIGRKKGIVLARMLKQKRLKPITNNALKPSVLSTRTTEDIEFNCIELDPITKRPVSERSVFQRMLTWLLG